MTCIVGITDGNGNVLIGGDSAGVASLSITVRADHKVYQRGPFIIGFTTSFRMGQLLQYTLTIPEHPVSMPDHEYMATRFIDAVRACLTVGGYAQKDNGEERGGTFLVGYRGRLYRIEDDYQVAQVADDDDGRAYDAVGCGHDIAKGSLYATDAKRNMRARAQQALEAAAKHSAGVCGPFHFIHSRHRS